jgi:hypothetical protein
VKRLLREEGDPIKKEFALCGSLGKENGVNGKGLTGGAQTRFNGPYRRKQAVQSLKWLSVAQ